MNETLENKLESKRAQMRRGVLELCVLSIISISEAYPSDIIGKLKESKLIVVEGTLYPLLNRLKNEGLLHYNWKESNAGPPRKYYYMTDEGKTFYNGLNESWKQLQAAVKLTINQSPES